MIYFFNTKYKNVNLRCCLLYTSMGCDVGCPFIGRAYNDNWKLEDPTGKTDDDFREGYTAAVSYTHLDVYKRQPIHTGSKEPVVWYQLGELMKNAKNRVKIHTPYIDVYKRQAKRHG